MCVPTPSSLLTTVTDHPFLFINIPQASTRNTFFCCCSGKGECNKVRERCFPKREMDFLKIGFRRKLYLFNSHLVKVQTLCWPRNLKALGFKLNIITRMHGLSFVNYWQSRSTFESNLCQISPSLKMKFDWKEWEICEIVRVGFSYYLKAIKRARE